MIRYFRQHPSSKVVRGLWVQQKGDVYLIHFAEMAQEEIGTGELPPRKPGRTPGRKTSQTQVRRCVEGWLTKCDRLGYVVDIFPGSS